MVTQIDGIIIPDMAQEKPIQCRIVSIGPRVTDLEEGQMVVVPKYVGTTIIHDDVEYRVIKVDDVMGIVKE